MDLHPLDVPTGLTPEAETNTERFHGSKAPLYVLSEEKPWHRAAALMFAAGSVTIKEVAEACDVSEPTVRNLLRQEWFQQRVTQLMAEHGGKDIMALFKAEAWNSLVTLIELRDDKKVSSTVKRACAVDILDRAYGKPIQKVETTETPKSSNPVEEAKRLEEENARLRSSTFSPPQ